MKIFEETGFTWIFFLSLGNLLGNSMRHLIVTNLDFEEKVLSKKKGCDQRLDISLRERNVLLLLFIYI